jgi:hypothetical protein
MEHNAGLGMTRKFAAVKVNGPGGLLNTPCTLEFIEDSPGEYFLILDTKQCCITIDMRSIDSFKENDKGKLSLVYFIP